MRTKKNYSSWKMCLVLIVSLVVFGVTVSYNSYAAYSKLAINSTWVSSTAEIADGPDDYVVNLSDDYWYADGNQSVTIDLQELHHIDKIISYIPMASEGLNGFVVSGSNDNVYFTNFTNGGVSSITEIDNIKYPGTIVFDYPLRKSTIDFSQIQAYRYIKFSCTLDNPGSMQSLIYELEIYGEAAQEAPEFSLASGAISYGSQLTITSNAADDIYYTTDGTTPATSVTGSTSRYIAPITIDTAKTVKAIAVKSGKAHSLVTTATYTQAASANLTNLALSGSPTGYTFAGGTYTYNSIAVTNGVSSITVTPTGLGTITVDGTPVTTGNASNAITLIEGEPKTITVVTTETGKSPKTYTLTVTRAMIKQDTPTFSPVEGAVAYGDSVTITSTGADTIYYTTDGSTPATSVTGSTLQYTAPITINTAKTIKAIAVNSHRIDSDVATAIYTQAATANLTNLVLSGSPTGYTFAGGTYNYNGISVANGVSSITVTPTGAGTITVDGTPVTTGNASGAIALTEGVEKTITVVATETGKSPKTYTLKVTRTMIQQDTPTFSPVAGAVAYGDTVTITSASADNIYYTTDGTTPATSVTGTTLLYSGPITIDTAKTVKAIAVKANRIDSNVATAIYTQAATANLTNLVLSGSPTGYTFAGGTYTYNSISVANGVSSITVTPTGTGTITVDGTPVTTGNASGSIALTEGVEKTISVVVTETGKTAKTYTLKVTRTMIQQDTPTFSPVAGAVAYGDTVTITSASADNIYYTTDGTTPATSVTGTTLLYSGPITIDTAKTVKAIAVKANRIDSNVATAVYTQAATANLTNLVLSGSPTGFTFAGGAYTYNSITVANDVSSITVTPTGAGNITVDTTPVTTGNASGAIALTEGVEKTITVVVTETGKSPITYTLKVTRAMNQQATPTFTPASGSISYGSTVTITSTGADAIYYTTDGTTPANSVTGTTLLYTNPIIIDTAKTIKAIATKSDKLDSNVATATYGQSESADLTDLTLSGNPSNYNFNGSIYAYNGIGVANEVSEITIKPTGSGDITINGTAVVTNTSSAAITLEVGVEKTIDVIVSESGKTSKTYTLKVTRSQPNITVPSAPTNVTVTAGNQQAVISFNVPADNGGSAITGYTVVSSPGAITVTGSASPITVTGLTNGTSYVFKVTATNAAGTSAESTDSAAVVPTAPPKDEEDRPSRPEPSSPSTPSAPSTAPPTPVVPKPNGVDIFVNGKVETAAVSETKTVNNQVVTTVTVDAQKVDAKLASEGRNTVITIPVNGKNDVAIGTLNGQTVKNMESKDAVLEIKTANVVYTLPASQINIDAISNAIGTQVALKDISVDVKISQPSAQTVQMVENTANKNNYQVVVKPVDFDITCTNGGKAVEVSKFNAYVERMVAIPDGVDPSKITTGIVLNADGTFSHVPTNIVKENDKYFAKINSLTNSSYSIIWSPKTFADTEKHWAKTAINDMGSRLIVTGTTEQNYEPDRAVTRAEFAEILVKGLGLKRPGAGKDAFTDVVSANWYYDSVSTATEYGLISGYGNGIFGANDQITREQAVTMLQKAMRLTELNVTLSDAEKVQILSQFKDSDKASAWAKDALATNVKAGIMGGKNDQQLAPKAAITRAEVAVLVRNLLIKSALINE